MNDELAVLKERIAALELLLMRKNAALDVFASKSMWAQFPARGLSFTWWGKADSANPLAFAANERDATEPDDRL